MPRPTMRAATLTTPHRPLPGDTLDARVGAGDSSAIGRSRRVRLTAMLDQMPVGIGVCDQGGMLFHANRNFVFAVDGRMPSLVAREASGFRGFDADGIELSPADFPCARALRGEVVTQGIDFLCRDGADRDRWIGVSAVPLHGEDGGIVGAVVLTQDIDERKRAADRLASSEMRFRQFAHNSRNALWIADPESGRFEYLSEGAIRVWGGPSGSLATLDQWVDSIHPDDATALVERHGRVARGHVERCEYRIVDAAGLVTRHLRETCFPIRQAADANVLIGSIVEDISQEKTLFTYVIEPVSSDVRKVIGQLSERGHRVRTFRSAADLLAIADVLAAGCVVVDLRAIGPDGRDVPAALKARGAALATLLIGPATASAAAIVAAMRSGAHDYIVPPFSVETLAASMGSLEQPAPAPPAEPETDEPGRFDKLSRREREVLAGLLRGATNKVLARDLGISPRTVEIHRARLMDRLNVASLSELLELAYRTGYRTGKV